METTSNAQSHLVKENSQNLDITCLPMDKVSLSSDIKCVGEFKLQVPEVLQSKKNCNEDDNRKAGGEGLAEGIYSATEDDASVMSEDFNRRIEGYTVTAADCAQLMHEGWLSHNKGALTAADCAPLLHDDWLSTEAAEEESEHGKETTVGDTSDGEIVSSSISATGNAASATKTQPQSYSPVKLKQVSVALSDCLKDTKILDEYKVRLRGGNYLKDGDKSKFNIGTESNKQKSEVNIEHDESKNSGDQHSDFLCSTGKSVKEPNFCDVSESSIIGENRRRTRCLKRVDYRHMDAPELDDLVPKKSVKRLKKWHVKDFSTIPVRSEKMKTVQCNVAENKQSGSPFFKRRTRVVGDGNRIWYDNRDFKERFSDETCNAYEEDKLNIDQNKIDDFHNSNTTNPEESIEYIVEDNYDPDEALRKIDEYYAEGHHPDETFRQIDECYPEHYDPEEALRQIDEYYLTNTGCTASQLDPHEHRSQCTATGIESVGKLANNGNKEYCEFEESGSKSEKITGGNVLIDDISVAGNKVQYSNSESFTKHSESECSVASENSNRSSVQSMNIESHQPGVGSMNMKSHQTGVEFINMEGRSTGVETQDYKTHQPGVQSLDSAGSVAPNAKNKEVQSRSGIDLMYDVLNSRKNGSESMTGVENKSCTSFGNGESSSRNRCIMQGMPTISRSTQQIGSICNKLEFNSSDESTASSDEDSSSTDTPQSPVDVVNFVEDEVTITDERIDSKIGQDVSAMSEKGREAERNPGTEVCNVGTQASDSELLEHIKKEKEKIYSDMKRCIEKAISQASKIKKSENTGQIFLYPDGSFEYLTEKSCEKLKTNLLLQIESDIDRFARQAAHLDTTFGGNRTNVNVEFFRHGIASVGAKVQRNIREILYQESGHGLLKFLKRGNASKPLKDTTGKQIAQSAQSVQIDVDDIMGRHLRRNQSPVRDGEEAKRIAEKYFMLGQTEELKLRKNNKLEQKICDEKRKECLQAKLSEENCLKMQTEKKKCSTMQAEEGTKSTAIYTKETAICMDRKKSVKPAVKSANVQKVADGQNHDYSENLVQQPSNEWENLPLGQGEERQVKVTNRKKSSRQSSNDGSESAKDLVVVKAVCNKRTADKSVSLQKTTKKRKQSMFDPNKKYDAIGITDKIVDDLKRLPTGETSVEKWLVSSKHDLNKVEFLLKVLIEFILEAKTKATDRMKTVGEMVIDGVMNGKDNKIANANEEQWNKMACYLCQFLSEVSSRMYVEEMLTFVKEMKTSFSGLSLKEIDENSITLGGIVNCLREAIENMKSIDCEMLLYYSILGNRSAGSSKNKPKSGVYMKWLLEEICLHKDTFYDLYEKFLDLKVLYEASEDENSVASVAARTWEIQSTVTTVIKNLGMHLSYKQLLEQRHSLGLVAETEENETSQSKMDATEISKKILTKIGTDTIFILENRRKKMKVLLLMGLHCSKAEINYLDIVESDWRTLADALVHFNVEVLRFNTVSNLKNLHRYILNRYKNLEENWRQKKETPVSIQYFLMWLKEEIVLQTDALFAVYMKMLELMTVANKLSAEQTCSDMADRDPIENSVVTSKVVKIGRFCYEIKSLEHVDQPDHLTQGRSQHHSPAPAQRIQPVSHAKNLTQADVVDPLKPHNRSADKCDFSSTATAPLGHSISVSTAGYHHIFPTVPTSYSLSGLPVSSSMPLFPVHNVHTACAETPVVSSCSSIDFPPTIMLLQASQNGLIMPTDPTISQPQVLLVPMQPEGAQQTLTVNEQNNTATHQIISTSCSQSNSLIQTVSLSTHQRDSAVKQVSVVSSLLQSTQPTVASAIPHSQTFNTCVDSPKKSTANNAQHNGFMIDMEKTDVGAVQKLEESESEGPQIINVFSLKDVMDRTDLSLEDAGALNPDIAKDNRQHAASQKDKEEHISQASQDSNENKKAKAGSRSIIEEQNDGISYFMLVLRLARQASDYRSFIKELSKYDIHLTEDAKRFALQHLDDCSSSLVTDVIRKWIKDRLSSKSGEEDSGEAAASFDPKPVGRSCQAIEKNCEEGISKDLMVIICSDGKVKYNCKICAKEFSQKSSCIKHTKSHLKGKECNKCGAIFFSRSTFSRHYKSHFQDLPQVPPQTKTVEGRKSHGCGACSLSCRSETHLKTHLQKHLKRQAYKCYLCNLAFTRTSTRAKHMQLHKIGEKGSPYQCTVCQNYFWFEFAVRNHFRLRHPDADKSCFSATLAKKYSAMAALSEDLQKSQSSHASTSATSREQRMNDIQDFIMRLEGTKEKLQARQQELTKELDRRKVNVDFGSSKYPAVSKLLSTTCAKESSGQNPNVDAKKAIDYLESGVKHASKEDKLQNINDDDEMDIDNASDAVDLNYTIEQNIDSDSDGGEELMEIKTETDDIKMEREHTSDSSDMHNRANKTFTVVSDNSFVNKLSSLHEIMSKLQGTKSEHKGTHEHSNGNGNGIKSTCTKPSAMLEVYSAKEVLEKPERFPELTSVHVKVRDNVKCLTSVSPLSECIRETRREYRKLYMRQYRRRSKKKTENRNYSSGSITDNPRNILDFVSSLGGDLKQRFDEFVSAYRDTAKDEGVCQRENSRSEENELVTGEVVENDNFVVDKSEGKSSLFLTKHEDGESSNSYDNEGLETTDTGNDSDVIIEEKEPEVIELSSEEEIDVK